MRSIAAIALLMLAGCKTCPIPEPPKVVRVSVDRYIELPEWATKKLPEDKPNANTPEEAVRLARARLETIKYANCRAELTLKLQSGQSANPKDCD